MNSCILVLEPKGNVLEVVRAASERGYQVVAISSDRKMISNAAEPYRTSGKRIDEVFEIESWDQTEEISNIVDDLNKRLRIVGVYCGMESAAVLTTKIRASLGLPTSDPIAMELVLDKSALRRKLRELGLSRLKNISSVEAETWNSWKFDGPAYFKPVHGLGSVYVQKCNNFEDFINAKEKWKKRDSSDPQWLTQYLNSKREYHLEEEFQGELLSVEAISHKGEFKVLGLLSRILHSQNPVIEMGSCFPYPHKFSENIISVVREAHTKLGLTDGPTHTEVIVNEIGEVEIIDLNPRFVGADVIQSVNFAYEMKVEELLLDFALGQEPNFNPQIKQFSCLQYLLPPDVDELKSVEIPEAKEIKFKTLFQTLGSKIKAKNSQLNYLACYLTAMPTFETAIKKSQELRTQIRINQLFKGVY